MTASAGDAVQRTAAILSRYRSPVLEEMRRALDRPGVGHASFIRYHLGWEDAAGAAIDAGAGKMLRPALCLLCCEAAGGEAQAALPAAAAIELLHNFTLIHDDIEDASRTRHGRPTLWTIAGVPQAINAGDGLFVIAQRTLLDLALAPDRIVMAARLLNDACVELCEGQYSDIGFEARHRVTRAEYEAMIGGKTAALLGAAAAIGALCGGADDAEAATFGHAGRRLGLAFQVQDDVLGIWGDPAVTGKPVADDIRSRKKSFPVVHAFDELVRERSAELEALYATEEPVDVERVLALLEAAGGRDAATAAARAYAAEALDALRPLALDAERRADIESIATVFVERRA